jgi:hypothetical protein
MIAWFVHKKAFLTRLAYTCFLVLLMACIIGIAGAFGSGRVGRSGNPNSGAGETCAQCHGGGTAPAVFLDGPSDVAPTETVTYTLRIVSGQEIAGGFNVSASSGQLAVLPGATDVKVIPWLLDDNVTERDELTHTGPKAVDGSGVVSFSFTWTAPDRPGPAVLYGAGNSVNLNGSPLGDGVDSDTVNVRVFNALAVLPVVLSD